MIKRPSRCAFFTLTACGLACFFEWGNPNTAHWGLTQPMRLFLLEKQHSLGKMFFKVKLHMCWCSAFCLTSPPECLKNFKKIIHLKQIISPQHGAIFKGHWCLFDFFFSNKFVLIHFSRLKCQI